MYMGCDSSNRENTNREVDLLAWNEIESESDAEFLEDNGFIDEETSLSIDNTTDSIDC